MFLIYAVFILLIHDICCIRYFSTTYLQNYLEQKTATPIQVKSGIS